MQPKKIPFGIQIFTNTNHVVPNSNFETFKMTENFLPPLSDRVPIDVELNVNHKIP